MRLCNLWIDKKFYKLGDFFNQVRSQKIDWSLIFLSNNNYILFQTCTKVLIDLPKDVKISLV